MYERFLRLLELNNKKQADVSKATGIAASVFSEWKKGKSTPKLEKLILIADYFNVTIDYLATGKDSKDLTTDEQELLSLYRAADQDGKNTIYKVAEALGAGKVKDGESGIPEAM